MRICAVPRTPGAVFCSSRCEIGSLRLVGNQQLGACGASERVPLLPSSASASDLVSGAVRPLVISFLKHTVDLSMLLGPLHHRLPIDRRQQRMRKAHVQSQVDHRKRRTLTGIGNVKLLPGRSFGQLVRSSDEEAVEDEERVRTGPWMYLAYVHALLAVAHTRRTHNLLKLSTNQKTHTDAVAPSQPRLDPRDTRKPN